MRVVLDTNIFISGIFWTGCPHKIIESWKGGKFALITSTDIISELVKVLGDFKIRLPDDAIREWADLIVENSEIVEPKERIDAVKDDPDDNMFIEAAVAGNADYIISQDKHLLRLRQFRKIRIITPEEFDKII
jgi:putative PIN family toxin of toxin-antitoxin system